MAFVEVHYSRRDAQVLQCAYAANTQQQFLTNANAIVSAIQTRSQLAVLGLVPFDIGIEQYQCVAAYR